MRAFLGIDFTPDMKQDLYEFQQGLRKQASSGRWKREENFHLTLAFLGEITLSKKKEIDVAMEKVCLDQPSFSLGFSELGMFPGRDSIRVLWLGLGGEIESLLTLHRAMGRALEPIGFPPEQKKFRPHITLGQDILFNQPFDQVQGTIETIRSVEIAVNKIHLFQSEQVGSKRVYTKISDYVLL